MTALPYPSSACSTSAPHECMICDLHPIRPTACAPSLQPFPLTHTVVCCHQHPHTCVAAALQLASGLEWVAHIYVHPRPRATTVDGCVGVGVCPLPAHQRQFWVPSYFQHLSLRCNLSLEAGLFRYLLPLLLLPVGGLCASAPLRCTPPACECSQHETFTSRPERVIQAMANREAM